MASPWVQKLKDMLGLKAPSLDGEAVDHVKIQPKAENTSTSSSLFRSLLKGVGVVTEYYFPSEIVGGTCPRVVGEEEEIVWNAAAEACDTERVHVVWHSDEKRVWYLAIRSSELASHATSWCPFGAILPGAKGAKPPPVCYTYFGEESATAMIITPDTLQIFRGTSPVIRAKVERASRELGAAPIVDLTPDSIIELTPVPWYSMSLLEDQSRRILAMISVACALGLAAATFLVWFTASMSLIATRHDMGETQMRTQQKATDLLANAQQLKASPIRDQLAKFTEVNDGLLTIGGLLEVYEIKDNKTRWRAVIPSNITGDRIAELGGKSIETTDKGMAIGNAAQIDYEKHVIKR